MQLKNIIKKIKKWLPKAKEQLEDQANELEAKLTDSELNPLPPEQLDPIRQDIAALPHPEPYKAAIDSKLTELLNKWQQGSGCNCLVVLSHATDTISSLLHQTLSASSIDDSLVIHSLPWSHRPQDYSTILTQLQQEIEPKKSDSPFHQLRVIPDLSWCFLRCLEGLDGVEWLQETLFQDQSQFWLIGCNYWTWQYLNCVYQWSDYFETTLELSALEALQIKQWLQPAIEKLDFDFEQETDSSESEDDDEDEWESKAERKYYERLADISLGTRPAVAQLWLNSLRQQNPEDIEETSDAHISAESESRPIVLARADLPKFPKLTKEDRYLLFSLGLHGSMTVSQLAISLGDLERVVQAQVQILLREGLIKNKQGWLSLDPLHYPRLKQSLENNQFLFD
ncbi:MAG: hypothetical protein WBA13_22560 [Microcoleaceae cyanobacterium]